MRIAITYFIVLCLTMLIAIGYGYLLHKEKQTTKRLLQNVATCNKQQEYYKTKNGLSAAKNDVLQHTSKELTIAEPKLVKELEDLNIKPKRMESSSETATETNYSIKTGLQDSITQDSTRVHFFRFNNSWFSIRGMAKGDTQTLAIRWVDSLLQVVYRGRRKHPYLWIFSPRILEQVITSKNPNTTIIFNKTIQIVKQ